ncbi:hypothetical protein [Corticicoccus populi]|uniref:Uncharacterized protein n=1 Tax=Corticicoccus populi TaxID=1812821 RepID=A0ABW5WU07_9STAP
MKITFEQIKIKPGYIKAEYSDGDTNHYIEFELSDPIIIRDDLIALSLAALCGKKYESINFDLNISEKTKKDIEKFTASTITTKLNNSPTLISKKFGNHTVNFSGGFDSLAAIPFLPQNHSLVSMDFGGHFKREMNMINKFDTHIVKTNILETDFRKNSWLFMVIGSILYSDYLNTEFNVFGSIINAAFMQNSNYVKTYNTPTLVQSAGMKNIPYTQPLSEIGSLRVSTYNFPHLINESLKSLANPKEEKRFRKQLLLEIEIDRFNHDIELTDTVSEPTNQYFKWGDNFLVDQLSFYIMKYKNYDIASLTISDIPKEAYDLAQNLNLSFYDRYYTDVLKFVPKQFRSKYVSNLEQANILPFEENDWKEYREVNKFLSNYHTVK